MSEKNFLTEMKINVSEAFTWFVNALRNESTKRLVFRINNNLNIKDLNKADVAYFYAIFHTLKQRAINLQFYNMSYGSLNPKQPVIFHNHSIYLVTRIPADELKDLIVSYQKLYGNFIERGNIMINAIRGTNIVYTLTESDEMHIIPTDEFAKTINQHIPY